ncbi:CcmD family protein [Sediminitomix flava]|uniref:CcmD family protein n=1 Tax=Sediminitomix flava TaxID=379075 RepID=A0A315ZAJ9_SEDFL|nr:CcmD family protein [Sediminitomix flava]PWJ42616.1 hypothetical protein BC781_102160 [Sediminitomix flava]
MKKLLIILQFVFTFLVTLPVFSQDKIAITEEDYSNQSVEMADQMRDNGKIYVVVAVVATILGGMFVYLYAIDKKVAKLEEMVNEQEA